VPRTKSSGLQDIEQTSQEQNAAECAKEDQNEAISRPGKMGHGSLPKYDSALQTSAEMINSDDDFLVAVLGVTGSGKSSFIKLIIQDDSIAIGDSLNAGKIDVSKYR
jgi:ribosome biogenesis GTPase A